MSEQFEINKEEIDLEAIQREVRESLMAVQNFLISAPVQLPYRNTLRELLSAAAHLTQDLGSEQVRVDEFREKLTRILEQTCQ